MKIQPNKPAVHPLTLLLCGFTFFSCVAQKVGKKEVTNTAKAEWKVNFPKTIEYVEDLPDPDNLYVFFMAGQSNMAGRGFVEPSDTIPNKRILTLDKANQWIYAKEPLHFYEPSLTGLDCGMSFAKKLLVSVPEGVSIALIPCAVGGSSIEQWLNNETFRGVALMDNFSSKIDIAKGFGQVKGIIWHQGESNAKPELIPFYSQQLDSLINQFRTVAEDETLPVIVGQLGSYAEPIEKAKRWEAINSIIRKLAETKSNVALVETSDFTHKGDKVHFDSASQRALGERFATKYLELIEAGEK